MLVFAASKEWITKKFLSKPFQISISRYEKKQAWKYDIQFSYICDIVRRKKKSKKIKTKLYN